jgi:hypothetical protein
MISRIRWWKATLVVVAVGVLVPGARFMAQGGRTADAFQGADEPKPQQPTPPKTDLNAEFVRRYALAPGQDLKRIAPPFNESRIEYYNSLFPGQRTDFTARDLNVLIFKQRESSLGHPAATLGGGDRYGTNLPSLLTYLADTYPQELEGNQELLQTFVEGDFVARKGVPTKRLIHLLEKILREECKLPLKLTLREVERNVVVARGRYKFRPVEPGGKAIEIYGQTPVGGGSGGGGSGEFEEMLGWVGRFTEPNSRIVNEVEEAPKGRVSWHLNERSPFTKETRQEDRDIALVFEHLADQTGLTFKHEERKVWVVSVEHSLLPPKEPGRPD